MGGGGVGKSCITVRLTQGRYVEGMDPTIEDSYQKMMEIDKVISKLDILDTAGQEDYASMRSTYYQECQGFAFVYSITKQDSFQELNSMCEDVAQFKEGSPYMAIIIGNKADLAEQRQVSMSEGKALADKHKFLFFETSAAQGAGVTESFERLVLALRGLNWTAPCTCPKGKCLCNDKCSKCRKTRNSHNSEAHAFRKSTGMCQIL